MNEYLLYGAIGVVVVLTIVFSVRDSLNPYVPAGPLFTKAELNFYRYLVKAVGGRAVVFGKVRIADVIQPKQSIKGNKRTEVLAKIAQKHFDFVIVHPETMEVMAAIELNDASHRQKDRAERDKLVRDAMNSSNIPLIEVPAGKSYDLKNLFKLLAPVLDCLPEINEQTVEAQPLEKTQQQVVSHLSMPAAPPNAAQIKEVPTVKVTPVDEPADAEPELVIPKLFNRQAILEMENTVNTTDMRVHN